MEENKLDKDKVLKQSENKVSMKSSGVMFVKENTGNIKDFYKISSCIGRGKYYTHFKLL